MVLLRRGPACARLSESHLSSRDVLQGALLLQVPDHHETSSVPNDHLALVDRVLLQDLDMLQIPTANVIFRNAGGDGTQRTTSTSAPRTPTSNRLTAAKSDFCQIGGLRSPVGRSSSPAGDLIQADVPLLQLSEARNLHYEHVSSIGPQQQQLPRRVGQHRCDSGHTRGGAVEHITWSHDRQCIVHGVTREKGSRL